jgi:hypothetical protein
MTVHKSRDALRQLSPIAYEGVHHKLGMQLRTGIFHPWQLDSKITSIRNRTNSTLGKQLLMLHTVSSCRSYSQLWMVEDVANKRVYRLSFHDRQGCRLAQDIPLCILASHHCAPTQSSNRERHTRCMPRATKVVATLRPCHVTRGDMSHETSL